MIGALAYYLTHSLRNRVRCRIRRLRQPKYLLALAGGLTYLYFAFFRRLHSPHDLLRPGLPVDPDLLSAIETGCAVLLLVSVLLPWVWPSRAGAIRFTESEIQMLFPAPVSRRALLNYRIAAIQPGILIGVLISIVILGRAALFGHPVYLALTLWLAYSFLALSRMGTWLAKRSMAEHGFGGLRRQAPIAVLLFVTAVLILAWWKWFMPSPPGVDELDPGKLAAWATGLFSSGPAYYLLLPFRIIVRPAFSPDALTFFIRLLPSLGLLTAVYFWVIRSDAAFEEAALERARRIAERIEAHRSGSYSYRRVNRCKVRRPLFRLKSQGPPFVAIFWKNLIAVGRLDPRLLAPIAVVAAVLFVAAVQGRAGQKDVIPSMIGGVAGGIALFLTLLGPVIIRDDLRNDLLQVHQIKTYPIPGWSIVLGEVLTPISVLAAMQWILLLIAAVVMPEPEGFSLGPARRIAFALSGAILLPCLTSIGVVIQNAAALLIPGWMQLGKEHARGIEAMGQRLLTMAATIVVLLIAVIPAGLIFGVIYFLLVWLIGAAALPLASLAAALTLLAEGGLGIIWLGRLWDRFDASRELDAVQ